MLLSVWGYYSIDFGCSTDDLSGWLEYQLASFDWRERVRQPAADQSSVSHCCNWKKTGLIEDYGIADKMDTFHFSVRVCNNG